jgi:hypothetical protein
MHHVYSDPDCICNGCMGLRMTKSQEWLETWERSYDAEPDLPFARRVQLVDLVVAGGHALAPEPPTGTSGQNEAPRLTYGQLGAIVSAIMPPETPPEVVEAARRMVEAPPPPAPKPAAKAPEKAPDGPKPDRFDLIEID